MTQELFNVELSCRTTDFKEGLAAFRESAHRSSVEGDHVTYIKYEVDGHKATITLNRPDALNALSPHMITELRAAYDEAENDDNIWITDRHRHRPRVLHRRRRRGDPRGRPGDLRAAVPVDL